MDEDAIKRCIDCRHYEDWNSVTSSTMVCAHANSINLKNLVLGPGHIYGESAILMRAATNLCGDEGKWWEAKQ